MAQEFNILNVRMQQKADVEENWVKNDPVLFVGEIAVSVDNLNNFKVGDGNHKWSELPYYIDNYRVTGTYDEIKALVDAGVLPDGIILNITDDLNVVDNDGAEEYIQGLFDGGTVVDDAPDIEAWLDANCDWRLLTIRG